MNLRTIALLAMAVTVGCPFQQEESDDAAAVAALATLSAPSSSLNSATVSFDARDFNDAPFNCSNSFAVSSTVSLQPLDLRFYISDVRLVKDDGTTVPVIMTADGKWQSRGRRFLILRTRAVPALAVRRRPIRIRRFTFNTLPGIIRASSSYWD